MEGVDGFLRARNYTPRGGRAVNLWVIHDEEYPEQPNAAWSVAQFFAGASAPAASAHACVDDHNAIGCVDWGDEAWHSGESSTNARSIGIEHSGYASQSREEWLDEYGMSMLDRSARLFAEIGHGIFGIPAVKLSPEQVAAGEAGICGHADVTYGFGIYGGHTDPGGQFPWDVFLDLVERYIDPEGDEDMKSVLVLDPADGRTVWECWGLLRKHIASEHDRDVKIYLGSKYMDGSTDAAFRKFCLDTTTEVK